MWFSPRVEGVGSIRAEPQAFVAAFARRIETGLFGVAPSRRSRYVVTRQGRDGLAFRATTWLTAFNVGLNDVELAIFPDRRVRYTIQYRRWAGYALLGGAAFLLLFGTFLLAFDIRSYIERNALSRVPSLSLEANVAIAWAMAFFWGLAWPWILIALHKRPLGRLMERLIAEADAAAMKST
jgi:hypothetical protein